MAAKSKSQPLGFIDDGAFGYAAGSYGWLVDAVLEFVPDLAWPRSVQTYARMRWDPVLRSILKAYTLPIRRATWNLDGEGCRPDVVQRVAQQLGLPIKGDATPNGPARRSPIVWSEHLRMALQDLTFGHMPFERTYDDGKSGFQGIAVLQERMPQTIAQINIDPTNGQLASIQQNLNLAGMTITTSQAPEIPAQNLVWYANDREGSAWTGQSLLRPAYASWLLKDEMRRVLATSSRRFGMGVPSVKAPPGGSASQVAQASALASAIRGGEQSGIGLPDGFTLELQGISGSVPDTLAFIQYLDQQMSRSALTGLLDLGNTPNGSRALGDTFLDLFLFALQTIADTHADTATTQLVVPLVDVNFGEDEPAPRIVCGDVASQHEVTAAAIGDLVRFGALQPDPSLDEYIRKEWKLPQRTSPWVKPGPPSDPNMPSPKGSRVAHAAGDAQPFRRDLTPVEAAAKTDFAKVQADWQTALAELTTEWEKITKAQRAELVAQVRSAVTDSDTAALATLAVSSEAAAQLLADRMHTLAATAAAQQVDEADAQGVTVKPGAPDSDRISGLAVAVAALAAASLASSAGAAAVQAWGPTSTAGDVAGAVSDHLSGLAGADQSYLLGGALSAAQNEGRFATLRDAPEATYVASEILDANVCDACAAEDGYEFADVNEAQDAYASGGYVECEGGLRCRGVVVTVWDDSASQQAA